MAVHKVTKRGKRAAGVPIPPKKRKVATGRRTGPKRKK